jgi:hypothetical protein
MTDRQTTLLISYLVGYLGESWNQDYRNARVAYFKKRHRDKWCDICGQPTYKGNRTIDHIIPQSVCKKLELYHLIIDERNFRLSCSACNLERLASMDEFPQLKNWIDAKMGEVANG